MTTILLFLLVLEVAVVGWWLHHRTHPVQQSAGEPPVPNEKPILHAPKRLVLVDKHGHEAADITTHDAHVPLAVKHGGKTFRKGHKRGDGAVEYDEVTKA